jgi:hypothetical protein
MGLLDSIQETLELAVDGAKQFTGDLTGVLTGHEATGDPNVNILKDTFSNVVEGTIDVSKEIITIPSRTITEAVTGKETDRASGIIENLGAVTKDATGAIKDAGKGAIDAINETLLAGLEGLTESTKEATKPFLIIMGGAVLFAVVFSFSKGKVIK